MKSKRHSKILELIAEQVISTQEELLALLKDEGFDVTQATVSRDIKELRLIKTTVNGNYRYTTANAPDKSTDISYKFHTIFSEAVINIDYAQNIVLVKCYTGMANAACAAMDSIHWTGVVGTLSGDDTIFVLCRNEEFAAQLCNELKKFLNK